MPCCSALYVVCGVYRGRAGLFVALWILLLPYLSLSLIGSEVYGFIGYKPLYRYRRALSLEFECAAVQCAAEFSVFVCDGAVDDRMRDAV